MLTGQMARLVGDGFTSGGTAEASTGAETGRSY